MYHIIVPIDFSEESLKGLELAILFAKKVESKIQMVYIRKNSGDFNAGSKEEKKYAEKKFNDIVREYQPLLPKEVNLEYIIKSGKIYREIVSQTESYENSFIVATTHGASGFEKFFIGSNALKIISATKRPVITLQGNKPPRIINKIILPLDITPETRQKLPFTAEIAKWFNAEVHVVTLTTYKADDIVKKLNSYSAQVCDYLKERDISCVSEMLVGSNLTDITIEYAQKVNAGLISIMTEQPVDVSNLILGSYAQQMLSKSSVPVMSMNPKELFVSGAFSTNG